MQASGWRARIFQHGSDHIREILHGDACKVAPLSFSLPWQASMALCAGKLFSFELLDAQGGEIRGCGFNQCVDKFEPLMQQGAVIMLSKANLKNKRPNSVSLSPHQPLLTHRAGVVVTMLHSYAQPLSSLQAVMAEEKQHLWGLQLASDCASLTFYHFAPLAAV